MLEAYPKARVIWCHIGRVRRPEMAPIFLKAPTLTLERLIVAHPNLFFDLSSSGPTISPGTNGFVSMIWDFDTMRLRAEWERLFIAHPWRFLAALDTGSDRGADGPMKADVMNRILLELPPEVRPIVAYKAAWKLLFDETLDDKL